MKLTYLLIVVFILSCILPLASTAQSKILTVIMTTQDTLRNCKIAGVDNDTVELILGDDFMRIPVDSVYALILPGESRFWTGAAIGGVLATLIGATQKVKLRDSPYLNYTGIEIVGGILIGAAAGFVIGGMIGSEFRDEIRYDLSGLSSDEKVNMLKSLNEN